MSDITFEMNDGDHKVSEEYFFDGLNKFKNKKINLRIDYIDDCYNISKQSYYFCLTETDEFHFDLLYEDQNGDFKTIFESSGTLEEVLESINDENLIHLQLSLPKASIENGAYFSKFVDILENKL